MGLLEAALFERLTGTTRQTPMQRSIEVLKSRSLALRAAASWVMTGTYTPRSSRSFATASPSKSATGSELLRISVQHVDPQEAMRIANTMVDVFVRTPSKR